MFFFDDGLRSFAQTHGTSRLAVKHLPLYVIHKLYSVRENTGSPNCKMQRRRDSDPRFPLRHATLLAPHRALFRTLNSEPPTKTDSHLGAVMERLAAFLCINILLSSVFGQALYPISSSNSSSNYQTPFGEWFADLPCCFHPNPKLNQGT